MVAAAEVATILPALARFQCEHPRVAVQCAIATDRIGRRCGAKALEFLISRLRRCHKVASKMDAQNFPLGPSGE
jgi:hypothetical protein